MVVEWRNVKRQRYCSKARCRRASKSASQAKWLSKPQSQDYFSGPTQVQRVRCWRDASFAFRGARALALPESVASEMAADSALNVATALVYVVLTLAFHATLATLVVSRLIVDLRRLSRHDGLTGLLNRRAMEEALTAQIQRSRRTGEPFTVLMLDLDHFKLLRVP